MDHEFRLAVWSAFVRSLVLYFLIRVSGQIRDGHITRRHRRFVENGATYWHLVDAHARLS
jgi:hypothetical protein